VIEETIGQGPDPATPSDPFAPALSPDPFFQPTPKKRQAATKKAVAEVSPEGEAQYGEGFRAATGLGEPDPSSDPLPGDEIDIGGKKYKFTEVGVNPEHNVRDYSAQDPNASLSGEESGPVLGDPKNQMSRQLEMLLGGVQNAQDISPNEYAKLTKEASKGNKLAQQILVKGKFKAQDYPSLTQDLNKLSDPFVQALSNLPNLANQAEAQTVAVTQPYDFSNAETQVNNILANQGSAERATPSAQTTAYANQLAQITSANPLTAATPGMPSIPTIAQALGGLGPAAKVSEKAAPSSALLAALLSHIQYEDVYGTGLSASQGAANPAWLQQLIAAVTGTGVGGGLTSPVIAGSTAGTLPSTGTSPIPNTG
jgi:hypothetical protein